MPRGGARPNSGPDKGAKYAKTLEKEEIRRAIRAIVSQHVEEMTSAQIAHAKGLKYLVARERATGKFVKLTSDMAEKIISGENTTHEALEVWEKEPSVQAFTDLMNRAADKPIEAIEQTVSGELVVTWKS